MRRLCAVVLAGLISACGGQSVVDAGPVDASTPVDASVEVVDAGHDAGLEVDAGLDAGVTDAGLPDAGLPDAGLPDAGLPDAGALTFTRSNEMLGNRSYVLATPSWSRAGYPVVIVLHGDGGNGAGIRTAFGLEASAHEAMLFVYPNAPGATFEYWTDSGRAAEVMFVTNLLDALDTRFGIDRTRVFIMGMSGGATMTNALGCRMGSTVVRGLGIHSGTLYAVNAGEFTYTGNGGVSCALPAALFIWGQNDSVSGTSYAQGQAVRDNYTATQMCTSATTPLASSPPCVSYGACSKAVVWCAIPGLGHSIWANAGRTFNDFFSSLR